MEEKVGYKQLVVTKICEPKKEPLARKLAAVQLTLAALLRQLYRLMRYDHSYGQTFDPLH